MYDADKLSLVNFKNFCDIILLSHPEKPLLIGLMDDFIVSWFISY